ncbi:MAG: hypothetical protein PVI26_11730 [Chitinispirillia bacterium]
MGPDKSDDADYLDSCRSKRNIIEYDYIGGVTNADTIELISYVKELRVEVKEWIANKYPQFL